MTNEKAARISTNTEPDSRILLQTSPLHPPDVRHFTMEWMPHSISFPSGFLTEILLKTFKELLRFISISQPFSVSLLSHFRIWHLKTSGFCRSESLKHHNINEFTDDTLNFWIESHFRLKYQPCWLPHGKGLFLRHSW